jgi:MFS family permease
MWHSVSVSESGQSPSASRVPRLARPFRSPLYRWLIGALALSIFGSGMWLVANVFQVRALGGTPIDLSFVATGNAVGLVAAVLLGGVAADRIPHKRILVTVELVKISCAALGAALALTGTLEIWHLALISLLLGVADGFFYPAYSAYLPSILPSDDLLAANGFEGVLRPAVMQAAGPAIAGTIIASYSPGAVFAVVAAAQVAAVLLLTRLRAPQGQRETSVGEGSAIRGVIADIRGGVHYMVRTPWLFATLLFALLAILVIMGPIEVLLPFAVTEQTGGTASDFAVVLASFGLGGVVGSIVVSSRRLPRRYLTVMIFLWGAGCLPLAVIGFTDQLWLMVVALFVVGYCFQAATVIWGTLLQRRVPPALLGRVSSLDFFVSLAFMPVSMALAGPVGELIGLAPTFLVAGVIPVFLAVAAVLIPRLPADEVAHPLDPTPPVNELVEPPSEPAA